MYTHLRLGAWTLDGYDGRSGVGNGRHMHQVSRVEEASAVVDTLFALNDISIMPSFLRVDILMTPVRKCLLNTCLLWL